MNTFLFISIYVIGLLVTMFITKSNYHEEKECVFFSVIWPLMLCAFILTGIVFVVIIMPFSFIYKHMPTTASIKKYRKMKKEGRILNIGKLNYYKEA